MKAFEPKRAYEGGHEAKSLYLDPRTKELGRDKARWVKRPAHHSFVDFNHDFRCAAAGVGAHQGQRA